jgi:hypothetical protein
MKKNPSMIASNLRNLLNLGGGSNITLLSSAVSRSFWKP